MKNNVLLDKNAGSRKLRDSCNEQGIVQCFLLPKAIRDTATDPDVAEFAVEHDDFILTFDRGFCDEASRVLAGRNPGVLLLREDDGSVKRITIKTAMAILSQFKEQFQEWPQVPCKNSVGGTYGNPRDRLSHVERRTHVVRLAVSKSTRLAEAVEANAGGYRFGAYRARTVTVVALAPGLSPFNKYILP